MKHVSKRILAWLLVLGMVIPTMGIPTYGEEQVTGTVVAGESGQETGTVVAEESGQETGTVVAEESGQETGAVVEEESGQETGAVVEEESGQETGTVAEEESGQETGTVAEEESDQETETAAEEEFGQETGTVAEEESDQETESEPETEKELPVVNTKREIRDDFHNQYGIVLYKEGKLSCEDDGVTFTHDEKSDNLIVSGAYESMKNARFLIDKEFDFGDQVVGRFSVDMTARKKTNVLIGFYLDDEGEPFATARLKTQKKENNWSTIKNISFDVYDLKLTGKHKLSFAVLENEKAGKNVEFCFGAVEWVKSTVPVIYFDIDESLGTIAEMNGSSDHSEECYGQMNIRVPEGYESEYGKVEPGLQTYELDYIRGRGNSTWTENKKPYKVKLEKKADLLGMGKQKHWVLLANYYDNSLLRNKFTYWMGEQINKEIANAYEFTPASVPVDVVMNGEYYGSYFLCEQIRMGENRVDLRNLEDYPEATEEATISGGYLLSLEPYGDEEKESFTTNKGVGILVESPDFEGKVNQAQLEYIKKYIQNTEDAIYGAGFKGADGTSYKDMMDVTSTAYYYLMQEFSKNGDAFYSTSTYLYKKPDVYDENGVLQEKGKLYWGPLWDFDYVAWGSTEYSEMYTEDFSCQYAVWFDKLFDDPEFGKTVTTVAWPVLRGKLEEAIADGGQLDRYYAQIESSADYNFEKWGFSPLEYSYDENTDEEISYVLTYEEELARLKEWVSRRIQWVDANLDKLAPEECTITFPGTKLKARVGLQGREFNNMPKAPKKKGYTFRGWELKYHYSYEAFMKAMGLASYKELVEIFGKAEAKRIKAEGYDETAVFTGNIVTLPVTGQVEARAEYVKSSEIILPTKLAFAKKRMNFSEEDIGAYYYLNLGIAPYDADYFALKWSSSDQKVASVEDGRINILGAGTCTISVKSSNGLSASCKVKVYSDKEIEDMNYEGLFAEWYKLEKESLTLNVGSYKMLRVNPMPETALYEDTMLYTTDYSVVDVDAAGMLYGVSEGSCLVYTYDDGGFQACKVTVKDPRKIHDGETFTRNGLKYKVTSAAKKEVACVGPAKKSVTKVIIPATLTYKNKKVKVVQVKASAFKSCKKLKTLVIGSNVEKIGSKAFYKCTKLSSVTIGKNVISEGSKAFYGCKALKTLRIKADPHKMYEKAYSKINASVKIYVPMKWKEYYKLAFKGKKVIGKY